MIYVGIDVAKDKHDCCILGLDTEELFQVFTVPNNSDGYAVDAEGRWVVNGAVQHKK